MSRDTHRGVKLIRPNKDIKRGVTLIVRELELDFENAFGKFFPEATDQQIVELTAAIEWLEQYADIDSLQWE